MAFTSEQQRPTSLSVPPMNRAKIKDVLSANKNAVLKSICTNCGLINTGTKPVLVDRIVSSIFDDPVLGPFLATHGKGTTAKKAAARKGFKLLAIDLGIKNFSYCKFVVPGGSQLPQVYEWSKLDVVDYYRASRPPSVEPRIVELDEDGEGIGEREKDGTTEKEDTQEKDGTMEKREEASLATIDYSPEQFSKIAFELAQKVLSETTASSSSSCSIPPLSGENTSNDRLDTPVDVVVIEEQRSRTLGSSMVLEWTLRVNMLEHMLHSTMYTMKRGSGTGKYRDIKVLPSSPRRMSDFWINYEPVFAKTQREEEESGAGNGSESESEGKKGIKKTKSKSSAFTKKQRINLIEHWMSGIFSAGAKDVAPPFTFSESLGRQLRKFLCRSERDGAAKMPKKRSKKTPSLFELVLSVDLAKGTVVNSGRNKNDDLADSLLHGVTWFQWMRNRQLVRDMLLRNPGGLTEEITRIEEEHLRQIR